jgi:hypothetical protein
MDAEEFRNWITTLEAEGRLTAAQSEDLLSQRGRFDQRRRMIEQEFRGRVVGYIADELIARDRADLLVTEVIGRYGGNRQLYFECITDAS